MDIEKTIQQMGKAIASIIIKKEQGKHEKINIESVNSLEILPITLKHFILKGDYNKAEDILFKEAKRNPAIEIYNIAENFYNTLLSKSDEELIQHNFSKEEIYQGLRDIKRIIKKSNYTKL